MEKKFEISLDSFMQVADAMTQARAALTSSPEERFNKGLCEAICSHIKAGATEAFNHKSRFPECCIHTYVAPFNKAFVEQLDEQSMSLLAIYGVNLTKPGSILITFRF